MMPDLPNMGKERDMEGFREYFENPQFRSDGLKIYPCLVIRGTGLYELWKTGALIILWRVYSALQAILREPFSLTLNLPIISHLTHDLSTYTLSLHLPMITPLTHDLSTYTLSLHLPIITPLTHDLPTYP